MLSSAPIRNLERKILLIPIIFMIVSAVCFISDLYFFVNYKKNLENLQNTDGIIVFVHLLIVSITLCVYAIMRCYMLYGLDLTVIVMD